MRASKNSSDYVPVYSSEKGSLCSSCGESLQACRCRANQAKKVLGQGAVRIRRETKGRGGKTVTTISGLALNAPQLDALLKELKQSCGSGGTRKEGNLEIQGDHGEKILHELEKRGFAPKRAGG